MIYFDPMISNVLGLAFWLTCLALPVWIYMPASEL